MLKLAVYTFARATKKALTKQKCLTCKKNEFLTRLSRLHNLFTLSHKTDSKLIITASNHDSSISNLTLFSVYNHFNTLKKKPLGKHRVKKVKLLKMSNFTFFHNVFCAFCILILYLLTKRQNFGLDQIQSICRRQNNSDSKIYVGKSRKHCGKSK